MMRGLYSDARARHPFALIALTLFLLVLAAQIPILRESISAADMRFAHFLFSIRDASLVRTFGGITLLGNAFTVVGVAGITLVAIRRVGTLRGYAAGFLVSIIGAGITDYVMKIAIARPRPGVPLPVVFDPSFSFPSGHAAVSVALYGFIAYTLCMLFPKWKILITILAFLLIVGIGFSRLYLGVHFLSDVLAGYMLGVCWLLLGMRTAHTWERRLR